MTAPGIWRITARLKAVGVSLHMLQPFAAVLARSGGNGDQFLADVGVDPQWPRETFVPGASVDRVVERLAEERGDPTLALTLARAAVAYPFGFFEHLAWTGATVREAFHRIVRFYGILTNRATVVFDERADGVAFFTQYPLLGAPRGSKVTEFAFALGILRARQAAGGLKLRAVRFVHQVDEASAGRYRELFEAPVHFDQELDAIEFDVAELERPVGTADATAAAALEAEALKMERLVVGGDGFLARVQQLLHQHSDRTIGLTELARAMKLSPRTVQRRLLEHETSLRALADDVRREQAKTMLDRGTSVGEVAFSLGFAHVPAFHKAFVRWTGKTPGAYVAERRRRSP